MARRRARKLVSPFAIAAVICTLVGADPNGTTPTRITPLVAPFASVAMRAMMSPAAAVRVAEKVPLEATATPAVLADEVRSRISSAIGVAAPDTDAAVPETVAVV